MFDNITVSKDYKLPINDAQQQQIDKRLGGKKWSRRFQTKDLDCLLNYYEIDKDGNVWEIPPKGERIKTDIASTIKFYDYITSDKMKTDLNITFEALILQGKVVDIKLAEFLSIDNSNRVKAQSQWQQAVELAEARRKKLSWKLYNVLYATHVNWFLKHLHVITHYISHKALTDWRRRLLFWD